MDVAWSLTNNVKMSAATGKCKVSCQAAETAAMQREKRQSEVVQEEARDALNPLEQDTGEDPNSKLWFTTSFLQPMPYLVMPWGPENCQLTSSFVVGAQTVVRLLQTTQIISDVCFRTDHVALHQLK